MNELRMYHPELVVQDATTAFALDQAQQEELRAILLKRGINKALLERRRFIALKHKMKERVKTGDFRRRSMLAVYEEMQHIAKMPRHVEWGRHVHKSMKNNEKEVRVYELL
jgi:hypothetical protein